MRIPQSKGCTNGFREPFSIQCSEPKQKRHIDDILDATVDSLKAWESVGVQLFPNLLFFGNRCKFWWLDSRKTQPVSSFQQFSGPNGSITHPDIKMKLCKNPTGQ